MSAYTDLFFFFPMSNNFFTNRDRAGIKIPFDAPQVYKLPKKRLMSGFRGAEVMSRSK